MPCDGRSRSRCARHRYLPFPRLVDVVDLSVFIISLTICDLEINIATSDKSIEGQYKRLEEELEVGEAIESYT